MIYIAIADGHPIMLEGIRKVLAREMDIHIMKEATTGSGVMEMLKDDLPDLLLIDIFMPDRNGLDLLKEIKRFQPDLPILILSLHPPDKYAFRCIQAGANGYISKSAITNELVKAIRKITQEKRRYITREVAQELASSLEINGNSYHDHEKALHEVLSDRELEVLCMIAAGNDVQKIAANLSLSSHTIHTYRSRIKKKLNLSSDVDMARYALQNGLIN